PVSLQRLSTAIGPKTAILRKCRATWPKWKTHSNPRCSPEAHPRRPSRSALHLFRHHERLAVTARQERVRLFRAFTYETLALRIKRKRSAQLIGGFLQFDADALEIFAQVVERGGYFPVIAESLRLGVERYFLAEAIGDVRGMYQDA